MTTTRQGAAVFVVVHALRLKGMAPESDLAGVTGLGPEDLGPILEQLAADGMAKKRTGRVAGWSLTPDGRRAHPELLADNVTPREKAGVAAAYAAFLQVNQRFKQVCTRWQLRPGPGGSDEPNDHSDAGYDAGVVDELASVHADAVEGLAPAVAASSRFARYPSRFEAALDRVRSGEVAAFARPMTASYHDVWMELHEDFLLTLGREREASDGH